MQQTCLTCKSLFVPRVRKDHPVKYCCRKCYRASQRKLPDVQCKQCGKIFRPPSYRKILCSKACSAKWTATHRKSFRGWYQDPKGYILIYKPDHPNAAKTGYVMEHRLLMSEKIGRPLRPREVVHHINEKKDDNRIENLELMTKEKHDGKSRGEWRATCPKCGHDFRTKGHVHGAKGR